MRCPVCDRENWSMVCPECGFDSSRDYGRYPALTPVENIPSVSALRREWEAKRREAEQIAAEAATDKPEQTAPPEPKPRKKLLWVAVLACVVAAAVGIWIGLGMGGAESGNWRENLLRSDYVLYESEDPEDWTYEALVYPVFGSEYQRWQIASVTFLDTLKNKPGDAWDVSVYGDGSVMAWVKSNGDMYDLFIGAKGGINGAEACSGLFAGYGNMERIRFGDAFHTEGATDMACMFLECSALETLDVSCLDTSDVQDMFSMFMDCWMLTELDLSGFDTSRVTDMAFMFSGCEGLTELDLSSFDTARVEDMTFMFTWCSALESLDLSSFDTARVQDMSYMFGECTMLKSLDLGSFNTENVRDMSLMFAWCESLTELDLSSFDTSQVENMTEMFQNCVSLTNLDLNSFDTANVLEATDMFKECPAGADWEHLLK